MDVRFKWSVFAIELDASAVGVTNTRFETVKPNLVGLDSLSLDCLATLDLASNAVIRFEVPPSGGMAAFRLKPVLQTSSVLCDPAERFNPYKPDDNHAPNKSDRNHVDAARSSLRNELFRRRYTLSEMRQQLGGIGDIVQRNGFDTAVHVAVGDGNNSCGDTPAADLHGI